MSDEVTFTILETAHGYEVYTKHMEFTNWKFTNVSKAQLGDLMLGLTQKINNKYKYAVLFEMG